MQALNKILFGLLSSFLLAFLGGVVIADLWAWFLIPVFPALEPITSTQGFGITLVINYLKANMAAAWHRSLTQEQDLKYLAVLAWHELWLILFTWGVAATVHTMFF